MGSLLVVAGPPGAGKSTVSAALVQRVSPSVLVEGDEFFGFLAEGGIDPWLPASSTQNGIVIEAAAAAAGRFAGDYATIFDGVVGPWYLAAFAAATGLRTLDYVMLLPPAEVCVARVEARQAHRFSDPSVTRKMHDDFAQAAISSRHVLTEGRWDPADTVEAIGAAREAGRLRYEVPS